MSGKASQNTSDKPVKNESHVEIQNNQDQLSIYLTPTKADKSVLNDTNINYEGIPSNNIIKNNNNNNTSSSTTENGSDGIMNTNANEISSNTSTDDNKIDFDYNDENIMEHIDNNIDTNMDKNIDKNIVKSEDNRSNIKKKHCIKYNNYNHSNKKVYTKYQTGYNDPNKFINDNPYKTYFKEFTYDILVQSNLNEDEIWDELECHIYKKINNIDPINSKLLTSILINEYDFYDLYLIVNSNHHLLKTYLLYQPTFLKSSTLFENSIPKEAQYNLISFQYEVTIWFEHILNRVPILKQHNKFIDAIQKETFKSMENYYGNKHVINLLKKYYDNGYLFKYFGSCATGLEIYNYSDIDLGIWYGGHEMLSFTNSKTERKRFLTHLCTHLTKNVKKHGVYIKINPILTAIVPILKIRDINNNIEMDLSVPTNVTHTILVTRLLSKYVNDYDKRVKLFILYIKYWSIKRKINGAFNFNLSSFAWTLLCISYLQSILIPLLPIINVKQKYSNHNSKYVNNNINQYIFHEKWRIDPCKNIKNTMNISELVYYFFKALGSQKWNDIDCHISRYNKYYKTLEVDFVKSTASYVNIAMEDPIAFGENIVRKLTKNSKAKLICEFGHTWKLLNITNLDKNNINIFNETTKVSDNSSINNDDYAKWKQKYNNMIKKAVNTINNSNDNNSQQLWKCIMHTNEKVRCKLDKNINSNNNSNKNKEYENIVGILKVYQYSSYWFNNWDTQIDVNGTKFDVIYPTRTRTIGDNILTIFVAKDLIKCRVHIQFLSVQSHHDTRNFLSQRNMDYVNYNSKIQSIHNYLVVLYPRIRSKCEMDLTHNLKTNTKNKTKLKEYVKFILANYNKKELCELLGDTTLFRIALKHAIKYG